MSNKKEIIDGAKAEASQEKIESLPQLQTKVEKLKLRFEVDGQKVAQLQEDKTTPPDTLKEAMDSARKSGKDFVMADTYAKLAAANSENRNSESNGPDIQGVANPADYELLA